MNYSKLGRMNVIGRVGIHTHLSVVPILCSWGSIRNDLLVEDRLEC